MTTPETYFAREVNDLMDSVPELETYGSEIKQTLHQAVLDGGEETRNIVDVLHGTWLGHPLHPMLTDITIGAWTLGALFDVFSLFGGKGMRDAADALHGIGTASAAATGITGLADYSTIPNPAVKEGAMHGLMNIVAFVLNLFSSKARRSGSRFAGMILSLTGLGISGVAAWLGGELVFRQRVGVNHAKRVTGPTDWTNALTVDELGQETPRRVEVAGKPVLLYRRGEDIYAIGAVCSHAGAPLEEGKFDGTCVQCPWHDSVFDLRDGSIVHGPATYAEPDYETRIYDGNVQVRVHTERS